MMSSTWTVVVVDSAVVHCLSRLDPDITNYVDKM